MPTRKISSAILSLFSQDWLQHSGFLRNVLALTTGTALSQAIMLLALPLLTRLYTPEDFGALAEFTVVSTTLCTLACIGYEPAIVLPKRETSALSLWVLCVINGVVISGICWLISAIWLDDIALILGNAAHPEWLNLIPLTLIIWAITVATTQWCTRHRHFANVSNGMVANRLATVSSQSIIGTIPGLSGPGGLIGGYIFGLVVGLGTLLRHIKKASDQRAWKRVRLSRIKKLMVYYRHFPGFGLASNLMGAIVRGLPVYALGYFFNPAAVGFFALANQLVAGPVQLITNSIVDVFFERAKRAKQEGNLTALTAGVYKNLISLLLAPLALLSIAAPELVALTLGNDWVVAGIFLRWMAIWFFTISGITPMFRIYLVLNRQKELATVNVISLIVSAATLVLGGTFGNAYQTIILFCCGSALVRTGEAMRVMHLSGNSMGLVFNLPLKEFFRSSVLILPMLITQVLSDDKFIICGAFLFLLGIFGITRVKSLVMRSN